MYDKVAALSRASQESFDSSMTKRARSQTLDCVNMPIISKRSRCEDEANRMSAGDSTVCGEQMHGSWWTTTLYD